MVRNWFGVLLWFICPIMVGCGPSSSPDVRQVADPFANPENTSVPTPASTSSTNAITTDNKSPATREPSGIIANTGPNSPSPTIEELAPPSRTISPKKNTVANPSTDTLVNASLATDETDPFLPKRKLGPLELVDVQVAPLLEFGLRHSESKHLRLITDLPEAEIPTEFHAVFEQAIGQWTEFCGADPRRFADWRLTCFLVVDEVKFQRAKLFPGAGQLPQGKLPPGGWQYGNQVWVRQQLGPYYTRHMLLHEATHAFFAFNFGALGSPWLAEGLAEYFAVHRWADGRLQLAARVTDKDELPYWGRVKLIRDAFQTGQPKTLLEVMKFPPAAFPQVESYAWSWAAVSLYAGHPKLRPAFLAQVQKLGQMTDTQWNRELLEAVPLSRLQLETQWQVDTMSLQYGHDFARTAIQWRDVKVADQSEYQLTLPADGAWHSTGLRLATGEWVVTTTGSYQVAQTEMGPLISEPDGVTIRYALGAPMGQVQFALQGDPAILQGMSELTKPRPLSVRAVMQSTGEELFVRVNDLPSHLEDNQGQITIVIRRK